MTKQRINVAVVDDDLQDPEKSLRFMRQPRDWPQWPFLPVKRPKEGEPFGEVGVMSERGFAGEAYPAVICRNIFTPDDDAKVLEYQTLEAVVQDGWRVD